jgi:hypothetical protein
MTQKCRTGESHGTLGQNFSKGVLKNFEKEEDRLSGSRRSLTQGK